MRLPLARPPLPFCSFPFPRCFLFSFFFFYTHTRHVGATSKWSSEGQLGVWLKSGEARCAVRGLAGVAVLEIRPCVPRLVMENPFKGETLLARVDEKLGSLPSPQTRLFWAWYFLKKRTIVSQTKWLAIPCIDYRFGRPKVGPNARISRA